MRHYTTKAEQEVIIEKATQFLKQRPSLSVRELYKLATKELGLQPISQFAWFYRGIKKVKSNLISQKSISQEPIPQEPIKDFLENIIKYKNDFNSLEISIEYIKERTRILETKIDSFKGLLERILGDLEEYKELKKEESRKHLPKVAIIGPLENQYKEISNRVGNNVQLIWIDKEKNINRHQLKHFNFIFINGRCGHSVTQAAKIAIGNEKVFFISGGIGQMSDKILEVIKK